MLLHRVDLDRAVSEDVGGHDRKHHVRKRDPQGRVRVGEIQDGRVVIRRIHAGDRAEHVHERVVVLHHIDRERHILRSDRVSVMEHCVVHQMQRDRHLVVGDLPAVGQVGLRLPVLVQLRDSGIDLGTDVGDADTRLDAVVHVRTGLARREHHRSTARRDHRSDEVAGTLSGAARGILEHHVGVGRREVSRVTMADDGDLL